jgi:hypothetical protein
MLQLAVFTCAGILAATVIAFELYRHFGEIADALAGRPRPLASRELDRWRVMHGAADRRGPYAIVDLRAAAPAEQGKRA